MLSRLHSVLIGTDDIGRLLPFYRDVLGLKVADEGEEFAVFEASAGPQLAIGRHSEVNGRARDPKRVMVDFAVDDCQAEYERLNKQGVEFIRAPSQDEGFVVATFLDPDGNILQLFEETG